MMEPRRGVAALSLLLLALAIAGCSGDDDDHLPAVTPTAAIARSPTVTGTLTAVPQSTSTATRTTANASPTPSVAGPTPSATPTETPAPPQITFFGVVRADDLPLEPDELDAAGRPVFDRRQGQAMSLVLEAQRGARPLELNAYDPSGGPRGVEFLVSRALGDGSAAVCDTMPPMAGGVPGFDPPVFSDAVAVQQAIDDLGCRVNDGTGAPAARLGQSACTRLEPTFEYGFVDPSSHLQYCLPIARAWSFAVGDTIVAARVRDVAGAFSSTREIVIRVEPEQPFVCDQGLGERAFVIRRPQSRLVLSDASAADGSVDPWRAATMRICAGRTVGNGIYPLSVREDVVLGVALSGGGVLCAKISARGSGGTIDCDGGTPGDARAVQDVDALTRIAVDSGLGVDAGTGGAVIRAPVAVVQLPAGATVDDCDSAAYPQPFNAALTTAAGTAQVLDLDGTVRAEATAAGAPFDCAAWSSGGAGALAMPFPLVNSPSGDRAAVLVLAE
jgi:hypothetical protein